MQNADYHHSDGSVTKETCLILELAQNGQLLDFVCYHGKLAEPVCRYIFKKIIGALAFCQSQGYAHRDLKPENILFGEDFELKLADFGFAKSFLKKNGQ